ncbi:MAG: VWA domain-containing protein [Planctomyces sp.]|nr:VWA domain-containing protein [Planctomyces sp.]
MLMDHLRTRNLLFAVILLAICGGCGESDPERSVAAPGAAAPDAMPPAGAEASTAAVPVDEVPFDAGQAEYSEPPAAMKGATEAMQSAPEAMQGAPRRARSAPGAALPAPAAETESPDIASEPDSERNTSAESHLDSSERSLTSRRNGVGEGFASESPIQNQPLHSEELWIITAADSQVSKQESESGLGAAGLFEVDGTGKQYVEVPLKKTTVTGRVDEYVSTVKVNQRYHNTSDRTIEAVYSFPLPDDAAVDEFIMTIGERRIRGIIKKREQAEQIYQNARQQGLLAARMDQQRSNVFTQHLSNIEPGKEIDIEIRYFSPLKTQNGAYEFVFPMAVGPRSRTVHSTAIGVEEPESDEAVDVQYLTDAERATQSFELVLDVYSAVPLMMVESVSHEAKVNVESPSHAHVELTVTGEQSSSDFVLRYQVCGGEIRTAMMTDKDEYGQYFTMMVYPPAQVIQSERIPMEMVYLLDCSDRLQVRSLEQAKSAAAWSMQNLTSSDSFRIVEPSGQFPGPASSPLVATPENIAQGLEYLKALGDSGDKNLLMLTETALEFPHDEGRQRTVVMMTDGFVDNEDLFMRTLAEGLSSSRIFAFGIGQSVNRSLMDRMAITGRGAVSYLSESDEPTQIMEQFQNQVSHVAMTDISISFGTMEVMDLYPRRIPDLIVDRPILLTGRYRGDPSEVIVSGRVNMTPVTFAVDVDSADKRTSEIGLRSSVAPLWARHRIADLMSPGQPESSLNEIIQTALNYNLTTEYTSFIVVDAMSSSP